MALLMNKSLLNYYEKELSYLHNAMRHYGTKYPNEAKKLGMHQAAIEDPSLARMLEGMALLTAKMQHKIDNQFNQVITDLLSILFPVYNAYLPSVAYIEFRPDKKHNGFSIPQNSEFSVETDSGYSTFTTIDLAHINPFAVESINTHITPFAFERPKQAEMAGGVIQIKLNTGDEKRLFSQLELNDLTFYLHGFDINVFELMDLLLDEKLVIEISNSNRTMTKIIDPNNFYNKAAKPSFNYIPQKSNELLGYHQLFEYINFKGKGQLFHLEDSAKTLVCFEESEVVINIYVRSLSSILRQSIDKETFKFNVFPVINLFKQRGEPINYRHHTMGMPVLASANIERQIKVFDVLAVKELTENGEIAIKHLLDTQKKDGKDTVFWQLSRNNNIDKQVEIILTANQSQWFSQEVASKKRSLKDIKPLAKKTIATELLCTNGVDAYTAKGEYICRENIELSGKFFSLQPPTKAVESGYNDNENINLLGLIGCNFNTLMQNDNPTLAIKNLLQLFSRNADFEDFISNIRNIEFKNQISPMRIQGENVFASGLEILVTLNSIKSFQLFMLMLNLFFQQLCSYDRYIQLKIYLFGKDDIVKCFPKYHGSKMHI